MSDEFKQGDTVRYKLDDRLMIVDCWDNDTSCWTCSWTDDNGNLIVGHFRTHELELYGREA